MATIKVFIESTDSDDVVQDLIDSQKPASNCDIFTFLRQYLSELESGLKPSSQLQFSAVGISAGAAVSCVSVVEDDVLSIGSIDLTAKDAPSDQSEFLVGISDTATAANLAACINANSNLTPWLRATSSTDSVSLVCIETGVLCNNISLASSGSTLDVSGPFFTTGFDANLKTVVL